MPSKVDQKLNQKTKKSIHSDAEIQRNEKLKIGEFYPVYLTHVNTPSNFFVNLIITKEKNYYRNKLHEVSTKAFEIR